MTDMPTMRAAFRTTVTGGGKYEMVFRFPNMEALHAADDEWRNALKPADATPAGEAVQMDAAPFIRAIVEERKRFNQDSPTWNAYGHCIAICEHVAALQHGGSGE